MARQIIDIGTAGNDGTGDDLRTGAIKINDNFDELYTDVAALQVASGSAGGLDGIAFGTKVIVFEGVTADSHETSLGVIDPTGDNLIVLPDSSGTVALTADITSIVDSTYISLITGTAFDSASTLTLIQANSVDSAEVATIIDSAYVNLRVDAPDLTAHAGHIVPSADSTYDLGDSNFKWKDLYLSGTTIHMAGERLGFDGTNFTFSQPVSLGENNVSIDSSNGFFVGAGFLTGPWRTGSYASNNGGGLLFGG